MRKTITPLLLTAMLGLAPNASAQTEVDASSYPQLTDLPTIYIATENAADVVAKDEYLDATLTRVIDGVATQYATTIKGRGNSTWVSSHGKRPYRLKFVKKQEFLGPDHAKNKSWTLLANEFDKSMIHNAVTHDLGEIVGMAFCPAAYFVDLYLNGDYRGTYQVSDHVNCTKKRIEVDEDHGWYLEWVTLDNAKDIPGVDGYGFQTDRGAWVNIKNPDPDDPELLTDEAIQEIKDFHNAMWNNTYNYGSDPARGYRAYLSEPELIDWYIATEVTMNYDGMITVKCYKDVDDDKIKLGPLWDEDLGYNNCSESDLTDKLVCDLGHSYAIEGLFTTMWQDPWFVRKVYDRWQELLDADIEGQLLASVDKWEGVIQQSQAMNYSKEVAEGADAASWRLDQVSFSWQRYNSYSTHAEYVDQLRANIKQRIAFLTKTFQERLDAIEKVDLTIDANGGSWTDLWSCRNKLATVTIKNKTISGSDWCGFSVPFSLSKQELEAVIGDCVIAELTGVADNQLVFTEADEILAGVPYMVKLTDEYAITEGDLVFTDVPTAVYEGSSVAVDDCVMKGNLLRSTYLSTDGTNYVYQGGELVAVDYTNAYWYGADAYFTLPQAMTLSLPDGTATDDESTAIESVEAQTQTAGDVYDLQGRKVVKPAKKGIYIQQGKKLVMGK